MKTWKYFLEKILEMFTGVKNAESPSKQISIKMKFAWTGHKKKMAQYFTNKEIEGLKSDVVYKLDRTRDLYGNPLIITSGYRDPIKNEKVGGVKDSSHTSGLGIDLSCIGMENQIKLAWALGLAGFRRIGVYPRHIHADTDSTKPQNVLWFGEYKGE